MSLIRPTKAEHCPGAAGQDGKAGMGASETERETDRMESNMTTQDLILNLRAAGFEEELIEAYLTCWKAGETQAQLKLLSHKRESLLELVHRREKQIDCLDYLVYQIKQGRVAN